MPVVGGFKHALVSDGTGLNVDNSAPADVRYGSNADMCSAQGHVRFTPNSDIDCIFLACPLWAKSGHLHSITSAACASIDVGTARPSALAVLRLITSSNLVGACTGRSAGFSPFKMRST